MLLNNINETLESVKKFWAYWNGVQKVLFDQDVESLEQLLGEFHPAVLRISRSYAPLVTSGFEHLAPEGAVTTGRIFS